MNFGIAAGDGGRTASFASGVIREMASTSWNAPLPALCVSAAPLSTSNGKELAIACGIYSSITLTGHHGRANWRYIRPPIREKLRAHQQICILRACQSSSHKQ